MGEKARKCRLWWPGNLSSNLEQHSKSCTFFFGWFIFSESYSQGCFDMVVGFSVEESALSCSILQEMLPQANRNMSQSLQDKCTFSLLGYYSSDISGNGQLNVTVSDRGEFTDLIDRGIKRPACGCHKVDGLLDHFKLASLQNNPLFRLSYNYSETSSCKSKLIPDLHHMHWNGKIISQLDLHCLSVDMGYSTKRPWWFEDLEQRQPQFDLEAVILAINSTNAAKIILEKHFLLKRSFISSKFLWRFSTFTWKLVAAFVASLATFLYIILQSFHYLLSNGSCLGIYNILANLFNNTWSNIELRCCQFLNWPILLQNHGFRSQSCVKYAEKVASRRHSMWSCLVFDIFLGNLFSIALLWHAQSACACITSFAGDITNYLLRNGCVWLMGNPAGFKLNTELARVLGMVSLNTIQIWSTLWSLMGFLFVPITKIIAISGSLFGFTASAALIIDLIILVTRHMFILHWLLSLIYSQQIMALAALWRLFRGRKWNPLRGRLDSYEYTVEQHIVGSLLFTPLLLLLPTTSAFYIFFAIMNTVMSFICFGIQFSISVIHATPYNRVLIWLLRKRRFPSGVWFEIISQHGTSGSLGEKHVGTGGSSSKKPQKIQDNGGAKHTILVTVLHSNYLNLGEVVWSNYKHVFSAVSRSAIGSLAYGVLTGTRIPSAVGTVLVSRLPWMTVSYREYWRLCYEAVLSCREIGVSIC